MEYGYVKTWNSQKGYGFIVSDDDHELFVHVSDLDRTVQNQKLSEGDRVGFDVRRDMKGDKAIRVRIVG